MRSIIFYFLLSFNCLGAMAQNRFDNTGAWNVIGNWQSNNIADALGEDVTFRTTGPNRPLTATVPAGYSVTVGNITLTDNNIIVASGSPGGTINVGQSGSPRNVIGTNNGSITVNAGGTMIIWGNLEIDNNFTLTVTGRLEIKGNVILKNGGTLTVSGGGDIFVEGSFSADQNTNITVTGAGSTIQVSGPITVGGGTSTINVSGGGYVSATSCSCSGCSGSVCPGTVTPITLLFFDAKKDQYHVNLNWSTSSEVNFHFFDIQRSLDGLDFSSIGKVDGQGTTNQRTDYQFTDDLPFVGKNYYRLKSVDFDGYTEYFKIVAIDFSSDKQFNLSPNPSDGSNIVVKTNFVSSEKASVIVYDNVGSVVGRFELEGNESEFNFSNKLKAGTYFAKVSTDGFTKVARFLVKE